MILIMLGTSPHSFARLLYAVDKWAKFSNIKVIAQTGHTPTDGLELECYSFVDHSQITKWIGEAEIVISQGGLGSLKDCLSAGKPTIAVPRRLDLAETMAEQAELVNALASEGRVIVLEDMEKLTEAIEAARNMSVRRGEESRIPQIVADKIHSVLGLA